MQNLSNPNVSPSGEDGQTMTFVRMRRVVGMTGLCRSTIYKMIAADEFPRPVKLGKRAVAWRRADLEHWSDQRQPRAR
jgi:prophage regulatory protein